MRSPLSEPLIMLREVRKRLLVLLARIDGVPPERIRMRLESIAGELADAIEKLTQANRSL